MVTGWESVDPEVAELLAGPDLDKLWRAARRRLEANGLTLYGTPLVLKGLSRDEADRRRRPAGHPATTGARPGCASTPWTSSCGPAAPAMD